MELTIFLVVLLGGTGLTILIQSLLRKRRIAFSLDTGALRPSLSLARVDNEAQFTIDDANSFNISPKMSSESIPLIVESKPAQDDTLLILSVMAEPGTRFASYDLLQAISSAGLKFGDMNIFHYTYPETSCGIRLFSLVSAEEPGEFSLDAMGDFTCPGLMLFMDTASVPDPDAAFNMMFEKASQLAEDLDGQLCADPKTPWTPEISERYRNKISQFWNHPVL